MIFANCNFGNTAKSIVRRRLHRQHCALARVVVVVKSRRQKSSSSFLAPRSRKRWWWSQRKKKKKKKCFLLCLFCASFSPEEKRPPFSFFILRTTLTRCVLLLRSAQPRETATTTRSSGRRKDHLRIVSRVRLNTNVLVRGGRRCISCGVEGTPTPISVGWTTPPTPTTVRIRGATSLRDVCVFFEKKTPPPPPPSPTTTTTTTTRVRGSRVGLRRRRSRRGFRDERDAVVDSAVPNSSLSTGSLSR